MNRRYIILSGLLILLGAGLLLMPKKSDVKEISPEQLLLAIDDPSRFLSTDLITDRIIKKDPSLMIVDLRNPEEFQKFSLPGAVNLPFSILTKDESMALLKQDGKDKVFISNDDVLADQVWQICKRLKIKDIFVMKGGINYWFNTIIRDNPPAENADSKALDLYTFRKAARMYFLGENPVNSLQKKDAPAGKEKIQVTKKPATHTSGGGC
jgi:rhodanese-related sulfurtransferase